MRILFVTCHLPYPPYSGGRLREHQLLSRLTQVHEVHVAAVTKTLDADLAALAEIPWEPSGVSLFPAAQLAPAGGEAPQVARHRSAAGTSGIRHLVAEGGYDVIHVEGFYLWQHVPRDVRPPTLLVEQNVEWQLYAQRGMVQEAAATRRAEMEAWLDADELAALTEEDWAAMAAASGRCPGLVPDGADHLRSSPRDRERAVDLLMVGNFAYEPNVDGARWLVEEVMPLVWAQAPQARLRLVGSSPPEPIRALAGERVEVTGRVPDVRPHLDAARVVVCPLRFGGGVKVKVLEALSAGKAIVSTAVGCQGLGGAAGAIHCHDDAPGFACATLSLLQDPLARARAESAAAAAILPCWDDAAAALGECWERAAALSLAAA